MERIVRLAGVPTLVELAGLELAQNSELPPSISPPPLSLLHPLSFGATIRYLDEVSQLHVTSAGENTQPLLRYFYPRDPLIR